MYYVKKMNTMKKWWMVAVATVLMVAQGVAQEQKKQMTPEQREARKEAMMENRCKQLAVALTLDDNDTARFIEVYKQYNTEMRELRGKYRMHHPKKGNAQMGVDKEPLTDEQIDENIRTRFAMSRAIIDVREKYYKEFRAFLNPKQIQKLYDLEKKQGEQMQRQHQKRGSEGGRPAGGQMPPRPRK